MTLFARLSFITCILACLPLYAAEFYVAPDGKDTNPGTIQAPFATLTRGQEAASAGDTVWIRGGVYEFSGDQIQIGVLFNKSGEENKRINYFAYQNETPIFDFFKLHTAVRIKGFSVTGNWLHFRGIEMRGVQQILTNVNESWAIRVEGGSNNTFERLNLHHNEGPGFFIADGGNNLVLNVDSHHNWDPDRGGENGDGFGGHSNDPGNIFRGCRAWYNADDGYDLINAPGQHTIEYCWAWNNGYIEGTWQRAGNGGGIKSGGHLLNPANFPPQPANHLIRFNLVFHNREQGFYANYHPAPLYFYNNTAFGNARNYDMQTVVNPVVHVLRNNVQYGIGQVMANIAGTHPDDKFNSWNLSERLTDDDFMSVVPIGVDGPRQADGSMPYITFMRPRPTSKLINAGTDVGLPFKGSAPDMGAFEYDPDAPPPPQPARRGGGGRRGGRGAATAPTTAPAVTQ